MNFGVKVIMSIDKCLGCAEIHQLANCPYCYNEYCVNCYVVHTEICEPERDKFL